MVVVVGEGVDLLERLRRVAGGRLVCEDPEVAWAVVGEPRLEQVRGALVAWGHGLARVSGAAGARPAGPARRGGRGSSRGLMRWTFPSRGASR